MSLRSLEPESEQTAKILLRQGRSESACRILESTMTGKAKTFGIDSVEFQTQSIENIETLIQNIIGLIETKKYDNAISPLNKIIMWTSNGEGSFPIQEPNRSQYRAHACFLNGCVEKARNNYEAAHQFYMGAAPFFESCSMVTELIASYVGASHCLIELNKDDEALAHLRTAFDLLSSPNVSHSAANPVHEAMALIYMKQGKIDQAKKSLELAISTRTLTEFIPKAQLEQNRCSSASSTHSAGPGPRPPSSNQGGARLRANIMMKQQRKTASGAVQPNPPMKMEMGALPYKELGQLKISVNRLMSCV